MLRIFKADLHVHTCLSPCADLSMGPRAIVAHAASNGLDVIGVCDHNSAENVPAVIRAARNRNIQVLPGMEVTSKEEVHLLALFDGAEQALRLQELVYRNLPGRNNPEAFGLQPVVNEDQEVVGFNERLLAGATELSVEEVVASIHALEGLAIASHVDREAFGIIGQLGFIPAGLELDALELSPNTSVEQGEQRFARYSRLRFLHSSDAHSLEDIGKVATFFRIGEPTTAEIRKALRRVQGRRIVLAEAAACAGVAERCLAG